MAGLRCRSRKAHAPTGCVLCRRACCVYNVAGGSVHVDVDFIAIKCPCAFAQQAGKGYEPQAAAHNVQYAGDGDAVVDDDGPAGCVGFCGDDVGFAAGQVGIGGAFAEV